MMNKFRNASIGVKIVSMFYLTLIVASVLATFFLMLEMQGYTRKVEDQTREDLFKQAKTERYNYVKLAYEVVQSYYNLSQDTEALKLQMYEKLKHVVDGKVAEVTAYYNKYKDVLPRAELEQNIKEMTGWTRFDDGNYIWINDTQSKMILHPATPELEGKDMAEVKDGAGKKFFKEFVQVCETDGGGMVDYVWDKPGTKGDPKLKISYVKIIPELGWIFGSGAWIDDITEEMKKEAMAQVSKMRLRGGNYFWIHDFTLPTPNMIMHSAKPELNGKPLDNPAFNCATQWHAGIDATFLDIPGGKKNLFQAMNEIVKQDQSSGGTGEGYVVYQWGKPLEGGGLTEAKYPKLSYVMLFPKWNWVIGMGEYVDTIDKAVAAQTKELNDNIWSILTRLFYFGLAFLFVVGALSFFIIKQVLNKPMDRVVAYASEVSGGNLEAVPEGSFSAEMKKLRDSIETMVLALRKELAFVQGMVRAITVPAIVVDNNGKISYMNTMLIHFLGKQGKPQDYVGLPLGEVFTNDPFLTTTILGAIEKKESVTNMEYEGKDALGARFFVKFDTTPFNDLDGNSLGCFTMFVLLTSIKEQEEALRRKNEVILQATVEAERVAGHVSDAASSLAERVQEVRAGSEQQKERTTSTATAMEEMNATVLEVAQNASQAAEDADGTKERAEDGFGVVEQARGAMGKVNDQTSSLQFFMQQLGQQADGISDIMNVISDIADQTNLLALNAAIEAARAGEAGRGFAVVADEVRKLAEKTMTATGEVGEAISSIQDVAKNGIQNTEDMILLVAEANELSNKSGEALGDIKFKAERTADSVRSIATASEEQSATSEEINRSVDDINQIAGDTYEGMQVAAEAVDKLAEQTANLNGIITSLQSDE